MDITAADEKITDRYQLIEKEGADILSSDEFKKVSGQKHHIFSTVGYHSIHVAAVMLLLGYVLTIDTRDVIRVCLWRDIGIYDRTSFAGKNLALEHPRRSLAIAEKHDKLSDTEKDMIANHMWPVCRHRPKTTAGFLMTIADKWCAITEFFCIKNGSILKILKAKW